MHIAHNIPIDADQVGNAAKLLKIGEFKLFAEAYRSWYGNEPSDEVLEPIFCRYLLENIVPFWVRSYVRHVLNDSELHKKVAGKRKAAACGYYVPIVCEFALIMYYLL